MIRLDNVSKQHGKQILFLEASMAANKGERVGLGILKALDYLP